MSSFTNTGFCIFQSRHATVSVESMLEALQRSAADKVWKMCHMFVKYLSSFTAIIYLISVNYFEVFATFSTLLN